MHTAIRHGWSFAMLPAESSIEDAQHADWFPVDIPHDWLISDTDHLYRDGDGWYRRTLFLSKEALSGHVFLSFDGIMIHLLDQAFVLPAVDVDTMEVKNHLCNIILEIEIVAF